MKILYVSTISNTINAFLIPHILMLIDQGHKVDIACSIKREIDKRLLEKGCRVYNICFSRSLLDISNIKAYRFVKKLVIKERYDIIHTHTPIASAITRIACKNIKETQIFYTAHGFHFYKGAPLLNWLIYYPIEKLLSNYTDVLITINKEDFNRAKKFKAKKLIYIPGVGIDVSRFHNVEVDRKNKRKEIGVPDDSFVLLSVGELNKRKNHEVVIKALAKLKNPNIYYIICGQGPLESYLRQIAYNLNVENQVKLLGFREDVNEIYKAADVFIFPSYREGLPVSIMEAMASGLPIICSNIRGNIDLIQDEKDGYLVNPNDINGFAEKINFIFNNNLVYENMNFKNRPKVMEFDIANVLESLVNNAYGFIK